MNHAIEALVGPPDRRSLPVAFDKNAIVQKLVEIANTDEDGIVHEHRYRGSINYRDVPQPTV